MTDDVQDVLVIGGGPGGSCAATLLARAGLRVRLLEKERFPRFHVGESLLPYNTALFDELGLSSRLESAGFVRKRGAQFHLGDGSKGTAFRFRDGRFTRHTEAWQVERSRFDEILLRHAAACGADVREETAVGRFDRDASGITVHATGPDGSPERHRARFLIDASGRGNVTGNQEGLRVAHPTLRKLAVFAHFDGVQVDPGEQGGDTVIVRLADRWFWLIPLGPGRVSVGLVMDRDAYAREGRSPEETFRHGVAQAPVVARRLSGATPVSGIQVAGDWSYRNRTLAGPRVVRVGDAAGFIDPIFSSGVFLAMHSARLAAGAVRDALARDTDGSDGFRVYERRIDSAMAIYREMVDQFYTTPFMEVFLEPRAKWGIAAAVNAVLAGELEGGWRLRWRMRLFFLLVRLQARRPFMPRIAFAPAS